MGAYTTCLIMWSKYALLHRTIIYVSDSHHHFNGFYESQNEVTLASFGSFLERYSIAKFLTAIDRYAVVIMGGVGMVSILSVL